MDLFLSHQLMQLSPITDICQKNIDSLISCMNFWASGGPEEHMLHMLPTSIRINTQLHWFCQHGDATGSSQLQSPCFNAQLVLLFVHSFAWPNLWVSSGLSCFLSPPQIMHVGELATLRYK